MVSIPASHPRRNLSLSHMLTLGLHRKTVKSRSLTHKVGSVVLPPKSTVLRTPLSILEPVPQNVSSRSVGNLRVLHPSRVGAPHHAVEGMNKSVHLWGGAFNFLISIFFEMDDNSDAEKIL